MPPIQINVAQTVACTEAEGPGRRFALWFQGCPLRCAECCNPEMLPFAGGTSISVEAVLSQIRHAHERDRIEGITLLGGEPFAHAAGAAELAGSVRERGLSVMVFSGYRLAELRAMTDPDAQRLLQATDLLVDGMYDRNRPDTTRRWIGSTNQQIHFLTDRYRAEDPCWSEPDTLEIRLQDGDVMINGFPASAAKSVWKRVSRS